MSFEKIKKFEKNPRTPKEVAESLAVLKEKVKELYEKIESGIIKTKTDFIEQYESDINELLSKIDEKEAIPFNEEITRLLSELE